MDDQQGGGGLRLSAGGDVRRSRHRAALGPDGDGAGGVGRYGGVVIGGLAHSGATGEHTGGASPFGSSDSGGRVTAAFSFTLIVATTCTHKSDT